MPDLGQMAGLMEDPQAQAMMRQMGVSPEQAQQAMGMMQQNPGMMQQMMQNPQMLQQAQQVRLIMRATSPVTVTHLHNLVANLQLAELR
jgi:hypothetical protein